MKDLLKDRPSKIVYIKADARAKYESVEDVVDNLRAGGVDHLGLLTEHDRTSKAPRPLDKRNRQVVDRFQTVHQRRNLLWQWQLAGPAASTVQYQHDADDRYSARAADYLHGDFAGIAARAGCSGAATATAESQPPSDNR